MADVYAVNLIAPSAYPEPAPPSLLALFSSQANAQAWLASAVPYYPGQTLAVQQYVLDPEPMPSFPPESGL